MHINFILFSLLVNSSYIGYLFFFDMINFNVLLPLCSNKVQADSKELQQALKRNVKHFGTGGADMFMKRNIDLVSRHLKAMDSYIHQQDARKVRVYLIFS